jgi:hypothetical protein
LHKGSITLKLGRVFGRKFLETPERSAEPERLVFLSDSGGGHDCRRTRWLVRPAPETDNCATHYGFLSRSDRVTRLQELQLALSKSDRERTALELQIAAADERIAHVERDLQSGRDQLANQNIVNNTTNVQPAVNRSDIARLTGVAAARIGNPGYVGEELEKLPEAIARAFSE